MALLVPVLGIEEVRAHRGWFLFMGVALIILGTIAIGSAEVMTMVSVMLIGWLLLFGGLFEIVHGFARRAWGGFFVNLMSGLLYAVTGLLMVTHPGVAAVTLTFMIAMLLIVAGTFRIFVAFATPIPHRGWLVLNGVISLFLGFSIMSSWPVSGLWVIGLFIGIDLIFDGWTEVMLALSAGSGGGPASAQPATA
ncbi:MAG: HdeD family acid-resistance protein [Candidatus Binatus sp.]|uniref:HdeD family acid-resistance protein n=1 Tax=Candidatus Binatus sp. TaxID=2811406 RepID=UPI003BB214EE